MVSCPFRLPHASPSRQLPALRIITRIEILLDNTMNSPISPAGQVPPHAIEGLAAHVSTLSLRGNRQRKAKAALQHIWRQPKQLDSL